MKPNGEGVPKSQEYFWSKDWQERIKASEEDLETGNYKTFKTTEELFADLDSLKNEEK